MSRSLIFAALAIAVLAANANAATHEKSPQTPLGKTVQTAALLPVTATAGTDTDMAPEGTGWRLTAKTADRPATLLFAATNGVWDLSRRAAITLAVKNTGAKRATIQARAETAESQGIQDTCRGYLVLEPGQSGILRVPLMRRPEDPTYKPFAPFFMYHKNINVRDNTILPDRISRLVVTLAHPESGATLHLGPPKAGGVGEPGPVAFFPFIDSYGQYRHTDWPGKIHNDSEMKSRQSQEDNDLKAHPGPEDWDKWGGWKNGPKQKATGFFYAAKWQDRWWLVDPDGALFFSYGPTGVGFGEGTPISDREKWFAGLPDRADKKLGVGYAPGHFARYMYYEKRDYTQFDFSVANARRKYGDDWESATIDRMHRRMRNWGFNTIANWSSEAVSLRRKTPYTVAIHYGGPWLDRIPDAFDPGFEVALRERMEQERGKSANDPWCLGYFVDNELWWGYEDKAGMVAQAALKAPAAAASKIKFCELLQTKYGTIEKLNAAWETKHATWDALHYVKELPATATPAYKEDCGTFGLQFAEQYFRTARRIVKSVAPNNLYLGVRFHGHIDTSVVQTAARYCDVISYNVYENEPGGRLNRYIGVVDAPFLIGEFGLDSDNWQTPFRGDQMTVDPDARSKALETYLRGAFRQPLVVGAHFFQFRDQPLSGRTDGEAVLRGMVDVADTPHFDLVEVNRRVAYELYSLRSGSTATAQ
ncbi:MAG: beta-galactosidase [Fibrella sp.]|nr:beta-galactosidase [Armatimonadota bacterium]